MKTGTLTLISLSLCCLAGCATPTDKHGQSGASAAGKNGAVEQQSQASLMAPQTPDLDEVVCKRITPTGSHLSRRHCMPRSSWLSLEKTSRETSEEMGRSPEQMQSADDN